MIMFSNSEDEDEVVQPGQLFIRRLNDSPVSQPKLTMFLCLLLVTVKRNRTFFRDSEDEEEALPLGKFRLRLSSPFSCCTEGFLFFP